MKFSREYAKFRIFYERIKFVSLKNAPKLQETIAAAKLRPQRQNNLSSAFWVANVFTVPSMKFYVMARSGRKESGNQWYPNMAWKAFPIRELLNKNMDVLAGYDSSSSTEEDKIQRKLTSKQVRKEK